MTKQHAISLFGGRLTDLSRALGVTVQAVSQWPDELTKRQEHEVIGAWVRANPKANQLLATGASR